MGRGRQGGSNSRKLLTALGDKFVPQRKEHQE